MSADVLSLAASLEQVSEHPLASAITAGAREPGDCDPAGRGLRVSDRTRA